MKNDPIATLLALALLVAGLATAGVTGWFWKSTRENTRLQAASGMVNRHRMAMQNLLVDVTEYSKRNPAIDPVLQSFGLVKAGSQPGNNPPKK